MRKLLGYLRYDTIGEMQIINDLYRNEFRLYKNFFQPVMKLISKERIGGKIRRKYDIPRTPYERLLQSDQTPDYIKKDLITLYNTLNPAVLKKAIDNKIGTLLKQYEHKANTQQSNPDKKQTPRLVTSYVI